MIIKNKIARKFGSTCKTLLLLLLAAVANASLAVADTVTDKLLARMLDRQIPATVLEAVDQPWTDGRYTIRLFKAGAPTYVSDARQFVLTLPLRAEMIGTVKRDFGAVKLQMTCKANFLTEGQLTVVPAFEAATIRATSTIAMPIPPVMANCDGLMLPFDAVLNGLVAASKPQWEAELNKVLNAQLAELGLQ